MDILPVKFAATIFLKAFGLGAVVALIFVGLLVFQSERAKALAITVARKR